MLTELSIRNFAIIETLTVSFNEGLTVLTGETGAGKSIIIDAIGLLIGGRGSAEFVRYGAERAEIEGLFIVKETDTIHQVAEEYGIDMSDGAAILRRDISASGKSICRINGKLVTNSILKEIGTLLIDVHGQHENQILMNPEHHLQLLDHFGKSKILPQLEEYKNVYQDYQQVKTRLKKLSNDEQQMAQRIDLLQFQVNEIEKSNLTRNEDELLLEEKQKLVNYEKLFFALKTSYEAITAEGQGLDAIGVAMSHLNDVSAIEDKLAEFSDAVSSAFYQLQETTYSMRDYFESLEYDEGRLNQIEARLNDIHSLKRKYGQDVGEILDYNSKIKKELEELTNREHHVTELEKELQSITSLLFKKSEALTSTRKYIAEQLTKAIMKELKELYMDKTKIEVNFQTRLLKGEEQVNNGEQIKFSSDGKDIVEFLISTNPGEPLKPLAKVASGGEISRIMLALKSIFSQHQGITSIIFDEVDTGVSGRVAQAIAEKINRLSNGSQVLCITHLPQVAAMSDTHLYISKHEKDDRTYTRIQPLKEEEKVKEIGRMISGVEVTKLTKEHARELLQLANKLKTSS